jgi:hypothetical protein
MVGADESFGPHRQIVIPDWPIISYSTESKDAFVVLAG